MSTTLPVLPGPRITASQRAALAFRDGTRDKLAEQTQGRRPDRDLTEEVAKRYGTNRAYWFKVKAIHAKQPDLLDQLIAGTITIPEAEALVATQPPVRRSERLQRLLAAAAKIREARDSLRPLSGYQAHAAHFGALLESINGQVRREIGKRSQRREHQRRARTSSRAW